MRRSPTEAAKSTLLDSLDILEWTQEPRGFDALLVTGSEECLFPPRLRVFQGNHGSYG